MGEGIIDGALGRKESGRSSFIQPLWTTMLIGQWFCIRVRERSSYSLWERRPVPMGLSSGSELLLFFYLETSNQNKRCCKSTSMGGIKTQLGLVCRDLSLPAPDGPKRWMANCPQVLCCASCFSHVRLFVTLWTIAHQAPLSLGFSR